MKRVNSANLSPPTPQRSRIMSAIRSKGNMSTENLLATLFRIHRISGWRRHLELPGTPDFAFVARKVAIFVDGCFWHGCRRCYRQPAKNTAYWASKIRTNKKRDERVARKLRRMGWAVMRIWEHSLIPTKTQATIRRIQRALAK